MPNRSKEKGNRAEREMVKYLFSIGLIAERVPLSGSVGGSFSGDLNVYLPGFVGPVAAEVKARRHGSGWATVERWLGDNELLFLKRDRAHPLVVMPWRTFSRVVEELIREDVQVKAAEQRQVLGVRGSVGGPPTPLSDR